ncbi:MAG TPA: hypothetical protein HA272_01885 [Methanoregula sp.]|nr:hypothetical protein [Methanoregula sp.]
MDVLVFSCGQGTGVTIKGIVVTGRADVRGAIVDPAGGTGVSDDVVHPAARTRPARKTTDRKISWEVIIKTREIV